MGLDRRIGPHFLHAGIGYGGSCFPKDVTALKQLAGNSGYHFQLLSSVIEVNELQKRRVIGKLEKHLGTLAGKIDRHSRTHLQAGHQRHARGRLDRAGLTPARRGRRGRAWDPLAERDSYLRGASFCDSVLEAVTGADAAVIVTEWKELRRARLRDRTQCDAKSSRSSTVATSSIPSRSARPDLPTTVSGGRDAAIAVKTNEPTAE